MDEKIEVRLTAVRYAARGINLFSFSRTDLRPLPTVDPGAHIDLHLEEGLVRQYSLLETGAGLQTYTVAVKREAEGRGGSRFVFDRLKVGDLLMIGRPRNNFRLAENEFSTVLIAGGIGITPIHAMISQLSRVGRPWELHYACRSRAEMPALDLLLKNPHVHLHFDDENAGRFLDIESIIATAPPDAHFYCCGPTPMLSAFEKATEACPDHRVHVEYFTAKEAQTSQRGFVVRLARSNRELVVPAGETILGVLRAAGIDAPFSCEEGICGACETAVLSGIPEHHDAILSSQEREANNTMMICCGGARSEVLVLDL